MTQIIVDVSKIRTDNKKTSFVAEWGDNRIERELLTGEISTAADFAAWFVHQVADDIKDDNRRLRLTIDFHLDGGGVPVVDSVVSATLPEDAALVDIAALPGWATWTATEAETWINTNVTDLDSNKVALVAMAKMLVALREAVRGLAERVR